MLCHNIFVQFSLSSFLSVHKCLLYIGYKILCTLKFKTAESDPDFKSVVKVAKKFIRRSRTFAQKVVLTNIKFLHSYTYGDNFVTFSTNLTFLIPNFCFEGGC
jgi:hypothetical protein